MVTGFTPVSWPGDASDASLFSYGTTAIARVEPSRQVASVATAIGELRSEGIPALPSHSFWKDKTREAKQASQNGSGEYLNYQFGWAPLISDVQSFATAVIKHDKLIRQYAKGSDIPIHRRYASPEELSQNSQTGQAIPIPSTFAQFGTGAAVSSLTKNRWFEGSFRYHVPIGESQAARLQRYRIEARKLLGLELTPETLWNLQPWSWALDWFGDTGDVIHNVSAMGKDAVAMQYGFCMESRVLRERHLCSFTYEGGMGVSSFEKIQTSKKRVVASPYGFGLTDGDLSTRQKAIIAALGIQAGGSVIR